MNMKMVLILQIILVSLPAFAADFGGSWMTTYGRMELSQTGADIHGSYVMNGEKCAIDGKIKNGKFVFRYKEQKASGEGWFALEDQNKFSGSWRQDGMTAWSPWIGARVIDYSKVVGGVFVTPYGRLRVIEKKKNETIGVFQDAGVGTLKNFTLKNDGQEISASWSAPGKEPRTFTGQRLLPLSGKAWLMVFESSWGNSLEDREYSFGDMVKAFFDRTPNVETRRRSFSDAGSLKKWLAELAFIPEPIVLTIASHGESDGLKIDGKTISANEVAEGLKYVTELRALHFSSCLVMKSKFGQEVSKALKDSGIRAAVSGYKNSVDWAASALFEMNYFDLILSRGLAAPEASKAALVMFPIAGDKPLRDVPVNPGGFSVIF